MSSKTRRFKLRLTKQSALIVLAVLVLGTGAVAFQLTHPPKNGLVVRSVNETGPTPVGGPTPSPISTPDPTPTLKPADPSVSLKIEGEHSSLMYTTNAGASTRPMLIELSVINTSLSKCKLTDSITLDDNNLTKTTATYQALAKQVINFRDGVHEVTASCTDGHTFSDRVTARVADRQPKLCKDFTFSDSTVTATSQSGLQYELVGTWQGCVTNPWMPTYYVTLTFRADGTYSAHSDEILDGTAANAMYWGGEEDSANKKWSLSGFTGAEGTGNLNLVWADGSGSVRPADLKGIKLMDNDLSFNLYYPYDARTTYGPLTFHLKR